MMPAVIAVPVLTANAASHDAADALGEKGIAVTAPGPQAASGPQAALHGTLLRPADRESAVVVIIPGSGPTDRDGNNRHGVRAAPYRLLAQGLARRGIASVRFDKRGMFASRAAVPDANAVTLAAYARDVKRWVATALRQTRQPCAWLVGHSEGGLVALVAAQRQPKLCGVILVAAPGRPFGTILREQLAANPANAPLLPAALAAISRFERGQRVDVRGLHPALQRLFAPSVQAFLIDLMAHDPAKLASTVRLPLLIAQGDKDIQVTLADARRLKAHAPRAVFKRLAETNHVLKRVTGDSRAANIATYANPRLPLAPGVIDAIAGFIVKPRNAR
ncbi:MAG: alpha/beta fold hydrolase [Pseudomonadota bacterium]